MGKKRGQREGSIYRRRSDGRWCCSLSLGNGGRKHIYGKTRAEVAVKLNDALKTQRDGLPVVAERQTVNGYLASWLESAKHSVRPRTYEAYELNVRRLVPHIGHVRLSRLTPAQIQSSYAALLEGDGLTKSLSKRSVEQAHTVLHRAMRVAVMQGVIVRNPTEAVAAPRPEHKEMRTLTHDEVQRLFRSTSDDRLHALWVLLATTGVRIGEALGLRWGDLDADGGRVNIQRALQRQNGRGLVFVEPKSAAARRVVHLARHTVDTLALHRKRQLEERLAAGSAWREGDLVFCCEDGRPLENSTVRGVLRRSLQRAELPMVRIHDLRHTAASLLLAGGVHPRVVQELLGHSTITLTLETYSHTTPALHQEAANQMDLLFRTA